jgi:hypothetical protein
MCIKPSLCTLYTIMCIKPTLAMVCMCIKPLLCTLYTIMCIKPTLTMGVTPLVDVGVVEIKIVFLSVFLCLFIPPPLVPNPVYSLSDTYAGLLYPFFVNFALFGLSGLSYPVFGRPSAERERRSFRQPGTLCLYKIYVCMELNPSLYAVCMVLNPSLYAV